MKYAYTIFYVDDVAKTISFYENAFGFQKKFITPEGDYAELNSGETTIAFASIILGNSNFKKGFDKASIDKQPHGVEIAFTTETIEEDLKKAIATGAIEYEPITKKPWG